MRRNNPLDYILSRSYIAAILIAALSLYTPLRSQNVPIALHKGTIEGRLPNGLHYLILKNDVPSSKIEFRLIMRVGSVQETENEKGCAHFLEHMAFGGTTHFPQRSLVNYLESMGVKYGIDINAFTGYDRTIYMFSIPTEHQQESAIDSSLLIIRDWLDGISFLPQKVESEKGIILEELRSYDVNDEFYSLKIGKGVFSRHLPLGTANDIRRVTRQTLKGYYDKWYVPSLATVVVVGDITPAEIEQKIKERFSSVRKGKAKGFRVYPLEYAKGIQLSEVRDSLLSRTKVELMIPHPCVVERSIDDAIHKEKGRLLIRAITQRFQGRRLKADVSDAWYLSDKNHFVIGTEGRNREELLNDITATVTELNGLVRNGWGQEELEDIRARFCRTLPDHDDEERTSASLCDDFVDYVISGDRYMTTAQERTQVKEAMMNMGSMELQDLLAEWLDYGKETLLIACHSHAGFGKGLTEKEITEAWEKGLRQEPEPYTYVRPEKREEKKAVAPACLAVRPPYRAEMIDRQEFYPQMNVTEVVLKNGIRLVMRPTQDADSTLYLTSFAPFGTSSLSDEQFPLLEGTAGYIDMGGLANADGDSLANYLSQQGMSLTVALESHWHGLMGMARADNAGEFFNLVYEKIFHPELRYDDFEEIRQGMMEGEGKESMLEKMLKRDSGRQLAARMNELMGAAVARPHIKQAAARLNLDSIAAYYKKLYTHPEGTTYVLCGNFRPDSVIRQFVAVFGRIPATPNLEYEYPAFQLPEKTYIEGFPNDEETQTVFDYLFYGHYQPCQKNTLLLKLMRDVIRNRLISVLRERESLVYSPYISLFYEGIPWNTFYFDLNASADNRNMEQIDRLLKGILCELQEKEVDEKELQSIKRSFLLAKREALNETSPTTWRTTLTGLLKNGETLADFEQYDQLLDAITTADLKAAFREWITPDNYVLLYLSNQSLKNETNHD